MIEKLYKIFLDSSGISTDTRTIKSGDIFFALKGPSFNANAFAKAALEKGAQLAVIDDPKFEQESQTLLVEDALQCLQDLARHHREQLKIPVIGLTGSNGKTTTKELIHKVLSEKYHTHATKGNLNNHIGVPLTLLAIKPEHEMAIIEMGANHVGDIQELCNIARPSHGFITNIGKAHIGEFGGYEAIIRGKSELYDFLIKTNGTVFINSTQPVLKNMGKRFANPLYYPESGSYCQVDFVEATPFVKYISEDHTEIETQLIGKYNFDNIATAWCVGKFFEVEPAAINRAIASYMPDNNRSQIIKQGSNTIILDAYNANPTSMLAAIENLKSMPKGEKGVILGDMFELGSDSESEHRLIGEEVKKAAFALNIFCGKDMKYAHEACPDSLHFETRDSLIAYLQKQIPREYTLLIKGSRGMGLEKALQIFD
ncbi:MAG: UDP-N-acetylmuramoyl-tripeptide--D-alanyl-D-alanine ligase [Cyclobacteriaceae bacterium]